MVLVGLILAFCVVLVPGLAPVPVATAVPGDPFDPAVPQAFLAQDADGNSRAQLFRAVVQPDGTVAYNPEGPEAPFNYNGIGFNPDDGYIYGVVVGSGEVVRVGQGGVTSLTGWTLPVTTMQLGTVADGVLYSTCQTCTVLRRVDLTTGSIAGLPLSGKDAETLPADWTLAGGFLWGIDFLGRMVRINHTTGAIAYFAKPSFLPAASSFYGAAWTLGNGNPVFQNNDTGDFYQVRIADPGAATPSFALVGVANAPQAASNDGASAPGNPTDLALVKAGPATYVAPQEVTYTFTVENLPGGSHSSGATVTDTLPAGVSFVSSSTSCAPVDGMVSCLIPALAAGETFGFTMTVDVTSGGVGAKTNTATVVANEGDTNPANDTSSTTMTGSISCSALYGLDLTVNPHVVWAIDAATGENSVVTQISDASLLNALAVDGSTDTLWALTQAGSQTSTTIHRIDVATGTQSTFNVPIGPASGSGLLLGAVNSANGLYYFGGLSSGVMHLYAVDTTNDAFVGQVATIPIPDAVNNISDVAFDGSGVLYFTTDHTAGTMPSTLYRTDGPAPGVAGTQSLAIVRLARSSTAQPSSGGLGFGVDGYLYLAATDDTYRKVSPATGEVVDTFTLTNTAAVLGDLASCALPSTITVQKDLPDGRSALGDQFTLEVTGDGVEAGDTGTTEGTELGLQDQQAGEIAGPLPGLAGTTYSIAESAAVGTDLLDYAQSWTCVDQTDGSTVASGSGADGSFTLPATGASGSNIMCTFTNTPLSGALSVVKLASLADGDGDGLADVGEVITYSFAVTNSGTATLAPVTVSDAKLGLVDAACTASLAPGSSVTCSTTADYAVTQADVDAGTVVNSATATGTTPGGSTTTSPPDENKVPTDQTGVLSLVKVADVDDLVKGEPITYTFTATNEGTVGLTDVAIREVSFDGARPMGAIAGCVVNPGAMPVANDGAVVLAPGEQLVCTASYTPTQADVDAGSLTNVATATGHSPTGPVEPPTATAEVPGAQVPGLVVEKRAAVTDVDENGLTDVDDEIDYAFEVTNTGNVTLTNIRIDDPMLAGAGIGVSCPSVSLAPGAETICTADHPYVITGADQSAGAVVNAAIVEVDAPPGMRPPTDDDQVTVPTDSLSTATDGHLPSAGMSSATEVAALGGVLLVAAGLGLVRGSRRTGRRELSRP